MSDALLALQAAAITAFQAHPALQSALTGIYDGPPPRARYPYLAFADALVGDWSVKGTTGREIRLALTLWDSGEVPARLHELMGYAQDAIAALPRSFDGWHVASNVFLRSFVTRDAKGPWAGLVEQRVRVLAI